LTRSQRAKKRMISSRIGSFCARMLASSSVVVCSTASNP